MFEYPQVKRICEDNGRGIDSMLDDFLIEYCEDREHVGAKFARKLSGYQDIITDMPENWFYAIITQYLAQQIFRENGYARKYRGHSAIRTRSSEDVKWFDFQIKNPWRYCYCSIHAEVDEAFFNATDVITGEDFLLYSPGIRDRLEDDHHVTLFFVLTMFNGMCWQTYGPLMPFTSLYQDDIELLSRQVQPKMRDYDEIPAIIDRDPLPYLLLWRWADLPLIVHKKDVIVVSKSDYRNIDLDPSAMTDAFIVERRGHVVKLGLKRWRGHPHFAECFYDEKRRRLILSSMTYRSWEKLISVLKSGGIAVDPIPDMQGGMNWVGIIGKLFDRDLIATPYDKLFKVPESPEAQMELDALNAFLMAYFDKVHSGTTVDVERLAREYNVDPSNARNIIEQIQRKMAL